MSSQFNGLIFVKGVGPLAQTMISRTSHDGVALCIKGYRPDPVAVTAVLLQVAERRLRLLAQVPHSEFAVTTAHRHLRLYGVYCYTESLVRKYWSKLP